MEKLMLKILTESLRKTRKAAAAAAVTRQILQFSCFHDFNIFLLYFHNFQTNSKKCSAFNRFVHTLLLSGCYLCLHRCGQKRCQQSSIYPLWIFYSFSYSNLISSNIQLLFFVSGKKQYGSRGSRAMKAKRAREERERGGKATRGRRR